MSKTNTATEPKKELTQTAVWPSPDFEQQVQRRRNELEAAIRAEKDATRHVEKLQEKADARNLPLSMFKSEVDRLNEAQSRAIRAVNEKRDELRRFQEAERAKFYVLKNTASRNLLPEISVQYKRAREAAAALHEILTQLLGAKDEIAFEEIQIKRWNRAATRINRAIPGLNTAGIPRVNFVMPGDSLRTQIAQMLIEDAYLRELCRGILATDAEKRQADEAREEKISEQVERQNSPINFVPPFFDDKLKK